MHIIQGNMKDGYYLTYYIAIGELPHLMNFFIKHDQNICLWKKVNNQITLIKSWELERFTGEKHHMRAFYNLDHVVEVTNLLLSKYNLSLNDIEGIWGCPGLDTDFNYYQTQYDEFAFHALLHLYTGMFYNSLLFYNEKMLVLAVDGGPDGILDDGLLKKYHYVGAVVEYGEIKKIIPIISPGTLWAHLSDRYKLKEGTLMALGTASTSMLLEKPLEIFELYTNADLMFKYKNAFTDLCDRIDALTEKDSGILFNKFDDRFTQKENKISMAVKVIQDMSYRMMERNVEKLIEEMSYNSSEYILSITGGYALNCGTNTRLMDKYVFKAFNAPPCVSDTGLGIGLGLYIFYKKLQKLNFKLDSAFYGESDFTLFETINSSYLPYIESIENASFEMLVNDLILSPIVWFDGNAEIGPRALGHRSILADPRNIKSKEILNDIKQRQWWRPVAPIILFDYILEWFDHNYESPNMLMTFSVLKDKREIIPAIQHLDCSARVQTLTEDNNPELFKLLTCFYNKTRVPIICNTSLNDRGEPIVNTIAEALNFALRKKIRVAYINGNRVTFKNNGDYPEINPHKRAIKFECFEDEKEQKYLLNKFNPFNITSESLKWKFRLNCFKDIDLTKSADLKQFNRSMRIFKKMLQNTLQ